MLVISTLGWRIQHSCWLKADAPENIAAMVVTRAVSHAPMSSLKVVLPKNRLDISITWLVSHELMAPYLISALVALMQ
jgi:hypothetical protein